MLNLIVKNFGVLQDIDIELGKTNLFIGDNGSGKSVLAKLITIITSYNNYSVTLLEEFTKFNINFIKDDTFIQYSDCDKVVFTITNKKINFSSAHISVDSILPKKIVSQYIPAERNLISIFNQSISNIVIAKIPLPDTLLKFAGEYNKARKEIKELNLLNMKYVNKNGNDVIYYNDDNYLSLENSSSGMQTALPMYLTLKYFSSSYSHIIIEEPELNLFPKTQVEAIKYIIETTTNNDSYIMTHSPYILSILNVLLFAYKASNTNDILKEKICAIIPKEQQINPDEFCAYLIENGVSKSIKGESTGMIQENAIDRIGDIIDDEFSDLMEIYTEFKSDK